MDKPLLTVIVPVYNVEKYLDRCLESVTTQTYRNLQIILVDDKSPDSSPGLCDRWAEKDSRISVVHKKVNEGLGMARNTGMEYAEGDYVTYVDSDDYLAADAYEKLMAEAVTTGADIVYMGHYRQQPDLSFVEVPVESELRKGGMQDYALNFVMGYTAHTYCCSVWSAVFSRKVAVEPFLSERVAVSEDLNWTLRTILRCSTVSRMHYSGYYYMYNGASITNTYNESDINKIVESAKVIDAIFLPLGVDDVGPTFLQSRIRSFIRNNVFACDLPLKRRRHLLRVILRQSDYRQFLKGRRVRNVALKEKLYIAVQKSGNITLNHIYGWIDYHIIVHKFKRIFKK